MFITVGPTPLPFIPSSRTRDEAELQNQRQTERRSFVSLASLCFKSVSVKPINSTGTHEERFSFWIMVS